jgi:hypothetical protein
MYARLPPTLVDSYRAGRLCLFLGAGVSRACGLPDWGSLASGVIERVPERRIPLGEMSVANQQRRPIRYINPAGLSRQAKAHLKNEGPLFSMRHLRHMADLDLEQLVASTLYASATGTEGSVIEVIVKLGSIRRICSFNYDDLLLTALDKAQVEYSTVLHGQSLPTRGRRTTVIFLHGFLPSPSRRVPERTARIVLSEDDYHDLYSASTAWPNRVLRALLRNYTGLFIGCSMQDPNLRRLLHQLSRDSSRRHMHYALLRDAGYLADGKWYQKGDAHYQHVQAAILKSLGVEPIWFGEFEYLPQILHDLSAA